MKRIVFALVFSIISLICFSQNGGTRSFAFLEIPVSTQASRNGGILPIHNHSEVSQIWENPAELNKKHHLNTQLNYTFYFSDASYASAAFAYDIKKYGNIALGIRHLGYGEFQAADELGNLTGSFSAQDNSIDLVWSKAILDSSLRIGVSWSNIIANYEAYSSYAMAGSVGISYHSPDGLFSTAIVARNIGTQIKPFRDDHYEKLPQQINIGISKKFAHAPLRLNLVFHDLNNWQLDYKKKNLYAEDSERSISRETLKHFTFGAEFSPSPKFTLGASYNFKRRHEMTLESGTKTAGFAWGIGIHLKRFHISFANSFVHRAGATQLFSIRYNFHKKSQLETKR